MTFLPSEGSPSVRCIFNAFNTNQDYDKLYIYNGADRNAPQFAGSPFSGTNLPGEFTASNAQGAITFYFKSNPIMAAPGWEADIFSTTISDLCCDPEASVNSCGLYANYPNPFNPVTSISYQIPGAGPVRLMVFDVLGREVDAHTQDAFGKMIGSSIYKVKIKED